MPAEEKQEEYEAKIKQQQREREEAAVTAQREEAAARASENKGDRTELKRQSDLVLKANQTRDRLDPSSHIYL